MADADPGGPPWQPSAAQGTIITVTSGGDELNGNVTTASSLFSDPGSDGISLREALTATNRDPGKYSIRFSPELSGTIIRVGTTPLPDLAGGHVAIRGDSQVVGHPDIVIQGAPDVPGPYAAFRVVSSHNLLYALHIQQFSIGVFFPLLHDHATVENNAVVNVTMQDVGGGISLGAGPDNRPGAPTKHRWANNRFVGNQIDASSGGIAISVAPTAENVLDNTTIAWNSIHTSDRLGNGIIVNLGFGDGSDLNRMTHTTIAYNTITGDPERGIGLSAGDVGSSFNRITDVHIIANEIRLAGATSPAHAAFPTQNGIALNTGDASTDWHDPSAVPAYPERNAIENVTIRGNVVESPGFAGIIMLPATLGGRFNSITNVEVEANRIEGAGVNAMELGAPFGGSRESSDNVLSHVEIRGNTVRNSGLIQVIGGAAKSSANRVEDVRISENEITGANLQGGPGGVSITGGRGGDGADQLSTNNTVAAVQILCNELDVLEAIGGFGHATGNRVVDLVVRDNLVGDALDPIRVMRNVGPGAFDNEVTIADPSKP